MSVILVGKIQGECDLCDYQGECNVLYKDTWSTLSKRCKLHTPKDIKLEFSEEEYKKRINPPMYKQLGKVIKEIINKIQKRK